MCISVADVLFDRFLKAQRKHLESKGLAAQFAKMEVKKLKELMTATLAVHAGWPKWPKALLEMSRDYIGIPALWQFGYNRATPYAGGRASTPLGPCLAGSRDGSRASN